MLFKALVIILLGAVSVMAQVVVSQPAEEPEQLVNTVTELKYMFRSGRVDQITDPKNPPSILLKEGKYVITLSEYTRLAVMQVEEEDSCLQAYIDEHETEEQLSEIERARGYCIPRPCQIPYGGTVCVLSNNCDFCGYRKRCI